MSLMRQAIKELLEADAPTVSALPGGIFLADDFGFNQGAGSSIPRETDYGAVLTFAILRFKEGISSGPVSLNAMKQNLEAYVYEDEGYDEADAALTEIYRVLHNQYIDADDRVLVHLWKTFESSEMTFEEFGEIPGKMMRFSITQIRSLG